MRANDMAVARVIPASQARAPAPARAARAWASVAAVLETRPESKPEISRLRCPARRRMST